MKTNESKLKDLNKILKCDYGFVNENEHIDLEKRAYRCGATSMLYAKWKTETSVVRSLGLEDQVCHVLHTQFHKIIPVRVQLYKKQNSRLIGSLIKSQDCKSMTIGLQEILCVLIFYAI
jgi:hypothetical protein